MTSEGTNQLSSGGGGGGGGIGGSHSFDDGESEKHRKSIIKGSIISSSLREISQEELIHALREEVDHLRNANTLYSASDYCNTLHYYEREERIPLSGMTARHVKERIVQLNQLDNKPRLNTSSYVNVVMEPEEEDVALLGLGVNLADGSVYPSSVQIHDTVVNMIAHLWNAPKPPSESLKGSKPLNYAGAGTVGSTEACLLAGLALKFRWRKWYGMKHGISKKDMMGIIPNIVISTCYQAAWEKFFRYMDVEPRFVKPSIANKMKINPAEMAALCDEKTLGVVGILGNHYNGAYDPIWDIDAEITKINDANNWQIGIHVDAASGGFIAPFQEDLPAWDFRLPNVLSISTSGHKFGESSCGTGWVVFRQREDLAEHIAISVSYLGGKSDSYTLNFSRPATAPYVQYYKLLRLGWVGYRAKVQNQMKNAKYLRDRVKAMKNADGEPWFEIVDDGDTHCLPVLGARLNPKLKLKFDDIDIQHGLAESHWYVSGYCLSFPNPANDEQIESLLVDVPPESTMFRVVVKSNLDVSLAHHLANQMEEVVPILNAMDNGMSNIATQKAASRKSLEQSSLWHVLKNADLDKLKSMRRASFPSIDEMEEEQEGEAEDVQNKRNLLLRQLSRMHVTDINPVSGMSTGKMAFGAC